MFRVDVPRHGQTGVKSTNYDEATWHRWYGLPPHTAELYPSKAYGFSEDGYYCGIEKLKDYLKMRRETMGNNAIIVSRGLALD